MRYLWDTNIAIYFGDRTLTPAAQQVVEEYLNIANPSISVITELQLLGFPGLNGHQFDAMSTLIERLTIVELNLEVRAKTIDIRRNHRIKLPDAIIAATALVYDVPLLTRNESDFQSIAGLAVINPFTENLF